MWKLLPVLFRSSPALTLAAALTLSVLPVNESRAQQQQEPTPVVFGDWYQLCGEIDGRPGESCVLRQDLVDEENQRAVMRLEVGVFNQENEVGVIITLPLASLLPPGIQVSVDGKVVATAPFRICVRVGCQSIVVLDDILAERFRKGNAGEVAFYRGDGQLLTYNFSLRGFTAGFAEVR